MTESLKNKTPEEVGQEALTLNITVPGKDFFVFLKHKNSHKGTGPDLLTVRTNDPVKMGFKVDGVEQEIEGQSTNLNLNFSVTFAPGDEVGILRCIIGGEAVEINLAWYAGTDAWKRWADSLRKRNEAQGLKLEAAPKPKPPRFPVAQGFNPVHHLVRRDRAGLPLFDEELQQFHELRTPLNWRVGLALFFFTSIGDPGGEQTVRLADLEDKAYSLTERGAPPRGDHRGDILAEIVKLFNTTVAVTRFGWEKSGRYWRRRYELKAHRVLAELGLSYIERGTGKLVRANDAAMRAKTQPLEVKGRRVYSPDGLDINALPGDEYRLDSISWRWTPSFVDDLKAAPAQDSKGNKKLGPGGKVQRTGYNILVAARIFTALNQLCVENSYLAHDLLVTLAHDICRPRKGKRWNELDREAEKLYDLLGLKTDPKNPKRREEAVARAICRLKQPDIEALLPGSDELPREDANKDRRKNAYYHLVRNPDYMPVISLRTKEEAKALEAEITKGPKTDKKKEATPSTNQASLPGLKIPEPEPLPSGEDLRAARAAAGLNLRDFAEQVGHGRKYFNTWARYERGEKIKTEIIPGEIWESVRGFVAKHAGGFSE